MRIVSRTSARFSAGMKSETPCTPEDSLTPRGKNFGIGKLSLDKLRGLSGGNVRVKSPTRVDPQKLYGIQKYQINSPVLYGITWNDYLVVSTEDCKVYVWIIAKTQITLKKYFTGYKQPVNKIIIWGEMLYSLSPGYSSIKSHNLKTLKKNQN